MQSVSAQVHHLQSSLLKTQHFVSVLIRMTEEVFHSTAKAISHKIESAATNRSRLLEVSTAKLNHHQKTESTSSTPQFHIQNQTQDTTTFIVLVT